MNARFVKGALLLGYLSYAGASTFALSASAVTANLHLRAQAVALLDMGNSDGAVALLSQQLASDYSDGRRTLAIAEELCTDAFQLWGIRHQTQAVSAARAAISYCVSISDTGSDPIYLGHIIAQIGMLDEMILGQPGQACAAYKQALILNPNETVAQDRYADLSRKTATP